MLRLLGASCKLNAVKLHPDLGIYRTERICVFIFFPFLFRKEKFEEKLSLSAIEVSLNFT